MRAVIDAGIAATTEVLHDARAAALCAARGVPALALRGRVLLGAGWHAAPPLRRAAMLLHERAHAAQQRAGARLGRAAWASPEAAEAEAHACAASALAGRPRPTRLAIDPDRPAGWAEAGHYYTVYFVLLAAGVDDAHARRAAFYCQLPDEVGALDAAELGKQILWRKDLYDLFGGAGALGKTRRMLERGGSSYDGRPLTTFDKDPHGTYFTAPRAYQYRRGGYDRDIFVALAVQMGLHALTGGDAEVESAKRVNISLSLDPRRGMAFGLSLHALGDSFAHRNGARMYPPPHGHGPHLHEPDKINPERGGLYDRYVRLLHGVAARRFGGRPILDAAGTADALAGALGYRQRPGALANAARRAWAMTLPGAAWEARELLVQDETGQIKAMRAAATRVLKRTMDPSYRPEEDPKSKPYPVTTADLQEAMRWAEKWSRISHSGGSAESVLSTFR